MQLLWLLAFGCVTVSAIPLEEEVTRNYQTENRINGVHGWHVPQPDGSLQWMNMETVKKIESVYAVVANLSNLFTGVKFLLYTERSPDIGEHISTEPTDIEKSSFNPEHDTYFVSHGFIQGKYSFSLNKFLREALFKLGPINFIYIDWADAKTINYFRSCARVPHVGKHTAHLFDILIQKFNMDCAKTHLIGHSLGAHVVGFAAKNIKSCKVPKITALDTALPLYPYNKPAERLNKTDALYVESIQTDAGVLGQKKPIGTASFYCNGGENQPGCGLVLYNDCCHKRSVAYFREAVVANNFPAMNCPDYRNALNKTCSDQYSGVRMADPNNHLVARGIYFVETNGSPPYGR